MTFEEFFKLQLQELKNAISKKHYQKILNKLLDFNEGDMYVVFLNNNIKPLLNSIYQESMGEHPPIYYDRATVSSSTNTILNGIASTKCSFECENHFKTPEARHEWCKELLQEEIDSFTDL